MFEIIVIAIIGFAVIKFVSKVLGDIEGIKRKQEHLGLKMEYGDNAGNMQTILSLGEENEKAEHNIEKAKEKGDKTKVAYWEGRIKENTDFIAHLYSKMEKDSNK